MSSKKLSTHLRFPIPENMREDFATFNKLAVIKGLTPIEFLNELVKTELNRKDNAETLAENWLTWEELEPFMQSNGFTISRSTFWTYRSSKGFDAFTKTNGKSVLYNSTRILAFFKGEKAQTVA